MKFIRVFFIFIILLSFFLTGQVYAQATSWKEAKQQKKAEIDLYWNTSKPFIYHSDSETPVGLEVEIIKAFQNYVKETYAVDLSLNWVETYSFSQIMNKVENIKKPNTMGVSAFSITDKRKKKVNFTNSYLSDVVVLVSSEGSKIVSTLSEINEMMENMTAISVKGTVYEQFLIDLRKQLNLNFQIEYLEDDQSILDVIGQHDNRFGFIDLPIYMMSIQKKNIVTRQNFFTVKGNGYAFIMPQNSDWLEIFNEFLADKRTQNQLAKINSKHIGTELYQFIEELSDGRNLDASILTKEKEIQLELLHDTNALLKKEKEIQNTYIVVAIVTSMLLAIIIILFYKTLKTTRTLSKKNDQIRDQQLSIQNKNEQLNYRNSQLKELNEEKNNLVRILAHDMRSPINHISGLANILRLTHSDYSEEDQDIINQIEDSVKRLNQMISKILNFDALEGNKMKVNREKIDITDFFRKIKNHLSSMAEQKHIRIEMIVENDLYLTTDRLLLSQILENLITNAIKFSPTHQSILIKAEDNENFIIFSVKDQGPGLTEEDQALAFKKFQKLSAKPTKGESSTGLGLSIVKQLTELLSGTVSVESKVGEGAEFIVELPKKVAN